jgi:hypothetical protein
MQRKLEAMERRSEQLQVEIDSRAAEIERLEEVRRSVKAEIVR